MVEDVRPSQLFRVLNSTDCSLADKLGLALQAWRTEAIDFPKKAVFLAQWALELGGGRSKEGSTVVREPQYWSLLRETLEAADDANLLTLTARNPTLVLAQRLLAALPTLAPDFSPLVDDATSALRLTLPVSLDRAPSFDRALELFSVTIQSAADTSAPAQATEPLFTLLLGEHARALEAASYPRKSVTHLLDQSCILYLRAFGRASPPIEESLVDVASATLLNLDNLTRLRNKHQLDSSGDAPQVEELEWFAPLRGAAQRDPSTAPAVARLLPRLFSRLLSLIPELAPRLFPFTHRASASTSHDPDPSASRSALDTHRLLRSRSLALHFLSSAIELLRDLTPSAAPGVLRLGAEMACRDMISSFAKAGLYRGFGGSKGGAQTLKQIAAGIVLALEGSAIGNVEEGGRIAAACVQSLDDLMALEPAEAIEPHLPAIFTALSFIRPSSPSPRPTASATSPLPLAASPLATAFEPSLVLLRSVLSYHSRTKSMPTLLDRLIPSTVDPTDLPTVIRGVVLGPEFTKLWMSEAAASLPTFHISSTFQALASTLNADIAAVVKYGNGGSEEAPPPPKKKRRRELGVATDESRGTEAAARATVCSHVLSHFILAAPLASLGHEDRCSLFEALESLRAGVIESALRPKVLQRLRKSAGGSGRKVVAAAARVACAVGATMDRWEVEEGEKVEAVSDEVLAAAGKALKRSKDEDGEPEMRAELARLLLRHIGKSSSPVETLSLVLDLVSSNSASSSFDGVIPCLSASSLPALVWSVLVDGHTLILELAADRVADIILDTAPLPSLDETDGVARPAPDNLRSVTARLLDGPLICELPALKNAIVAATRDRLSLGQTLSPREALSIDPTPKFDDYQVEQATHALATLCRLPPSTLGARAVHDLVELATTADVLISRSGADRGVSGTLLQVWARHFIFTRGLETFQGVGRGKVASVVGEAGVLPAMVFTRSVTTCQLGGHLAAETAELVGRGMKVMLAFRRTSEGQQGHGAKGEAVKVIGALDAFLGRIEGLVQGTMKPDQRAVEGSTGRASVVDRLVLGALEMLVDEDDEAGVAASSSVASSKPLAPLHMALVVSRLHDFLQMGDSASAFWRPAKSAVTTELTVLVDCAADHLLQRALSVLSLLHDPPSPGEAPGQLTSENVAAALRLFQHHVDRRRQAAQVTRVTAPYELLVGSYAEAIASFDQDGPGLEAGLAGSVRKVSAEEYAAAMEGVAEELAREKPETTKSKALIRVASVLLRRAPDELSDVARRYLPVFFALAKEAAAMTEKAEALCSRAAFVEELCKSRTRTLGRQEVAVALGFVLDSLRPIQVTRETDEPVSVDPASASRLYRHLCAIVGELARNRRVHAVALFPLLMMSLAKLVRPLQRAGFDSLAGTGKKAEREARSLFPPWAWSAGRAGFGAQEAGFLVATIKSVTVRTPPARQTGLVPTKKTAPTTLVPALSKHAPFLMVVYLRACADPLAPLPLDVKEAVQPAVFEIMSAMGQHERGALMKSFLGKDDETERAMLKSLWRTWDRQRYKGQD